MRRKLYDEASDGDGGMVHFVPAPKCDGVQGYVIRPGPSPLAPIAGAAKRERARAERKRLKKHKRRGR